MTRMSIAIEDVDDETVAKIFTLLGVSPGDDLKMNGRRVSIPAPPPPPEPVGWNAETARVFVGGLRQSAMKVLTMMADNNGRIGLDTVIKTLGLKDGKALGGAMSSVGHNLRSMIATGLLPEGTEVYIRDEESREFRFVVSKRTMGLIASACHRRIASDNGAVAVAVA